MRLDERGGQRRRESTLAIGSHDEPEPTNQLDARLDVKSYFLDKNNAPSSRFPPSFSPYSFPTVVEQSQELRTDRFEQWNELSAEFRWIFSERWRDFWSGQLGRSDETGSDDGWQGEECRGGCAGRRRIEIAREGVDEKQGSARQIEESYSRRGHRCSCISGRRENFTDFQQFA